MKPRNKFQHTVIELSKRLPEITEPQKRWAYKHCFEHIGKRNATGKNTCLECGHTWQGEYSPLADAVVGCRCPNCSADLQMNTTRQRVFKESEYLGLITTCGGFQVIRYFFISVYRKAGAAAVYTCTEVSQRWLSPQGKEAIVARLRSMSLFYYDLWDRCSPLEIRPFHHAHNIRPAKFYPRQTVIPELKRNGFTGNYFGLHPFDLFQTLLSSDKAETLLKAGQYELLKLFARKAAHALDGYWPSIRICLRNNFLITDPSTWCDYIDNLVHFGKDVRSPKYVCPNNLRAEHDRYVQKRRTEQQREEWAKRQQSMMDDEQRFRELRSGFFGLAFSDGTIHVRVLESVREFVEEGARHHHCVASNKYYLRPNSLILTATLNGQPLETIEVSLESIAVVQSRGVHNSNTPYHDRIIELVNKNRNLIRSRMEAA